MSEWARRDSASVPPRRAQALVSLAARSPFSGMSKPLLTNIEQEMGVG